MSKTRIEWLVFWCKCNSFRIARSATSYLAREYTYMKLLAACSLHNFLFTHKQLKTLETRVMKPTNSRNQVKLQWHTNKAHKLMAERRRCGRERRKRRWPEHRSIQHIWGTLWGPSSQTSRRNEISTAAVFRHHSVSLLEGTLESSVST